MVVINQALQQLDTSRGKIFDQQLTIEVHIHNTILRLQQILDVRKTQLITQLHQIIREKLKNLSAQKDKLETTQAQLSSCADFMKKSMATDSHSDVLNMKSSIIKQAEELTTHLQPDYLNPCVEADLAYSGSADTIADCRNYGQLSGPSFPDLSKCHMTGYNLEIASLEEKSTVVLHAVDRRGKPCRQNIRSVTV